MNNKTLWGWPRFSLVLTVSAFAAFVTTSLQAQSQWSKRSDLNNIIIKVLVSNQGSPAIARDGLNGAVITWVDKNSLDIYAQRIDEAGRLVWSQQGAPIAVGSQEQKSPSVVGDLQGNVFIAWLDRGNLFNDAEVRVQMFNRDGLPQWPSSANPVPTVAHQGEHSSPLVLLNEISEVITASYSTFGTDDFILAQIIDENGRGRFSFLQGVVSQNARGRQPDQQPAVVAGLNGGIVASWADAGAGRGVLVKGLLSTGNAWTAGEKILSDTVTVNTFPVAVSDGSQGAIIVWIEPTSSANDIIKSARVDVNGANVWAANVVQVATTSGSKKNLKIAPDGENGAFLIWENTLPAGSSIYIQRILNQNGDSWANDVEIAGVLVSESHAQVLNNGFGAAIVAWQNNPNGDSDIFAQFIDSSGQALFPADIEVTTANGPQNKPVLIDDGVGGAIITWEDLRDGDSDIYAQRVNIKGTLGEFRTIELTSPNVAASWEIGSTQTIRWSASTEIENIKIELSRDNGESFETLDVFAPNTGRYDWQVSGRTASQCLVKIQAAGTDFLVDESEQTFAIVEQAGPLITPEIIITATAGQALEITSLTTDVSGVADVALNLRPGGARDFSAIAMTAQGQDHFSAIIPANAVTERGLEYFVGSTDSIGIKGVTDTFFVAVSFDPGVQTAGIASGSAQTSYRMISAPNILTQPLADSVFALSGFGAYDTTSWRMFEYKNAINVERDSANAADFIFNAGRAYWLISSQNRTIDFGAGFSRRIDASVDVELQPGWNQVGQPFAFTVSWGDIGSSGNLSMPYSYLGNYSIVDRLAPYQGYFVFNFEAQPVRLTIPPLEFDPTGLLTKSSLAVNWQLQIFAMCEQASDESNYLGIHRDAKQNWDSMDQPEPPPIGEYIALYFPKMDWQIYPNNYTTDFRGEVAEGQIWSLEVRTNIGNAEAQILFSKLQDIPLELQIVLLDEKLSITQDLRAEPSFTFPTGASGTTKSFKLAIGRGEFISEQVENESLIPGDFQLEQNFPNPFNPATSIRYGLPKAAEVTVRIYDLLGKEVITLMTGEQQEAGYHLVSWNGRDRNDRAVASGLYFYQILAGRFTQTRKMLLVK